MQSCKVLMMLHAGCTTKRPSKVKNGSKYFAAVTIA
jgi:hypothetical protein